MILGGPAGIKSRVLKAWNLELLQPIVVTLSRGGEEGLRECINKAADLLANHRVQDDAELLRDFYFNLERAPDSLVVGNEIAPQYHQGLLKAIYTTDIASIGPEFGLDQLDEEGENNNEEAEGEEEEGELGPGRLLRYGTRLFVVAANSELGTQFERQFMGLAAVSWTA